MHPELFTIFGFTIYTYGVLLALAYLSAIGLSVWKARQVGLDTRIMLDLSIIVLVGAIVGAKLFYLLGHLPEMFRDPGRLMVLLRAGGVFQGGLIVAGGMGIWYLVHKQQPVWDYSDVIAPAIALGQAIGRIGCFCAGCCYGKPAEGLPWSVTFPPESVGAPPGVHLHPVQLYESAAMFLVFAILMFLWRHRSFSGQIFWSYVIIYSVVRGGVIEWFRGDHPAVVFGLSGQQVLSVATLLIGIGFYIYLSRKAERSGKPAGA